MILLSTDFCLIGPTQEFPLKGTKDEPAGFVTLGIIDATPTLGDEVAKAMIAAKALSDTDPPTLGEDAIELAKAFGSIIMGLDGVVKLVDELAEVKSSKTQPCIYSTIVATPYCQSGVDDRFYGLQSVHLRAQAVVLHLTHGSRRSNISWNAIRKYWPCFRA